ncbi:hypothetical protein EI546_13915 [Aequorivita sp. H23M31]|uniref:Uncharacterized protein n=1 Tax=Aequorivita ciconiae TaxID=2494375 RepID=A0A410G630_9FLAO|nr:hypothetical protein [Aequorivita sp. H23M31]QAA82748.1 hypothetical protein EI546_13915 [Aequorivita sp. H23M31]
MKNNLFFLLFLIGIFSATAQVGIGTNSPTATLHVKGTYSPPNTSNRSLFTENFNSWAIGPTGTNSSTGSCTTTNGWEVRSTSSTPSVPGDRTCASCSGKMLYASSYDTYTCNMDATAIVNFPSNPDPTAIEISVKFDYYIRGAGERLQVYLYNNTLSSSVEIANLTGFNNNASYSGNWPVVGGNSYSLHFRYTGNYQYYTTVDNIKVTEKIARTPASYAFRIDDGNVQPGDVLTTDGYGNAAWKSPSIPRPMSSDISQSEFNAIENSSKENQQEIIHELQQAIRERQVLIEAREEKIAEMEEVVKRLKIKD